ncbi:chitin synthase-domain-containing protein [Gorgonomyces haynaldii]|nr:chitin synthase-domain-containing protein [Gorgonomyces haynaldii]
MVLKFDTVLSVLGESVLYREYQFSNGRLVGFKCVPYLLRNDPQASIFALLLSSQEHCIAYGLAHQPDPEKLKQFKQLKKALKHIGIGKRQQHDLFRLLATLIHLNGLKMDQDPKISDQKLLKTVCEMLGLDTEIFEQAMTTKETQMNGERVVLRLSQKQAQEQLETFHSNLYFLLYHWVVEFINDNYCRDDLDFENYIGVFSMPEFKTCERMEDAPVLGFYDMLFNYGQERLLEHYYQNIDKESDTLKLFNHLYGVLPTLNRLTCQNNGELWNELTESNKNDPRFVTLGHPKVAIVHTGRMLGVYNLSGWTERNHGDILPSFVTLVRGDPEYRGTSNGFLRALFSSKVIATLVSPIDNQTVVQAMSLARAPSSRKQQSLNRKFSTLRPNNIPVENTLAYQFDASLTVLFDTLNDTQQHFLICLKSNNQLDRKTTRQQMELYCLKDLDLPPLTIKMDPDRYLPILNHLEMTREQFTSEYQDIGPFEFSDQLHLSDQALRGLELMLKSLNDGMLQKPQPSTQTLVSSSWPSEFDDKSVYSDADSQYEQPEPPKEMKPVEKALKDLDYQQAKSTSRQIWLLTTFALTWWVPTFCLQKHMNKDRIIAWREKVALCIVILFMNAFILFFIIGLGPLVCPRRSELSPGELSQRNSLDDATVYLHGHYYQIQEIAQQHLFQGRPSSSNLYWQGSVLGRDVSSMFSKEPQFAKYCPGITKPKGFVLYQDALQGLQDRLWHFHSNQTFDPIPQLEPLKRGTVVWDKETLSKTKNFMIAYDAVYDLSALSGTQTRFINFMGADMGMIIATSNGLDATPKLEQFKQQKPQEWKSAMGCLNGLFYVGSIDHRNDLQCQITNYILLGASCLLVLVIGVKFLASLQLKKIGVPEEMDKFAICLVPCYTENEQSLRKTIDSIASLDYSDKRRLLFVVCDGMVIGNGNDRPTPRIVLDILENQKESQSFAFESLGVGHQKLNYGKVYSGLYKFEARQVPYIVVVKTGKPSERNKPGNSRGKRDTQTLVLRFLSKIYYSNKMNPLEQEIYRSLKHVIGFDPALFEYLLMVDADTQLERLALGHLVSRMVRDTKICGIAGETRLSNETQTWITSIQVYEYFISQHMAKAFESIFGSVTCLPGCFSLYRIHDKRKPVLVKKELLDEYCLDEASTLHLKNLLHLGEDRFLTTLLIKHFPQFKTKYTPAAICYTTAPHTMKVLLSQRRRWINSTVHNLLELLSIRMCGAGCFSMRFVVFLDLMATLIQPATIFYLCYLIYVLATDKTSSLPLISFVILGAIYGLQMILFLIKLEVQHIGWMLAYLIALPLFTLVLPLYSFWHFDDFSWGDTRRVYEYEIPVATSDQWKQEGWTGDEKKVEHRFSFTPETFEAIETVDAKDDASDETAYGQVPSDQILETEIRAYLSIADLTQVSRRSIRLYLEQKFGFRSSPETRERIYGQIEAQMATLVI